MRTRSLVTLALVALLACTLVVPGATAATPTDAPPASVTTATAAASHRVTSGKSKHKAIERYVLAEVNKARTRAGLKKLERSAKIVKVARTWSVKQATRGRLAHNPGYAREIPQGWTRASENVAWTSAKGSAKKLARRVVRMWLDSEGHRTNILGSGFTKTGVGVARSAKHGWFVTQNFSD